MVLGYFLFVYTRNHEDNTSGNKKRNIPGTIYAYDVYKIQFITDQLPQCHLKKRSISHDVQYVDLKIIIFRSERAICTVHNLIKFVT